MDKRQEAIQQGDLAGGLMGSTGWTDLLKPWLEQSIKSHEGRIFSKQDVEQNIDFRNAYKSVIEFIERSRERGIKAREDGQNT